MRISLKYKLFFPLVLAGLVFGAGGYWLIKGKLSELRDNFVQQMAEATNQELESSINILSQQVYEKAAMFSQLPAVLAAYEQALAGDIDDERSPASQEARQNLRAALNSFQSGYKSQTGENLQLHFHLPNARSLLRLWREKQAKRDGKWVDISDDISSFRKTVIEVNETGEGRKGIELGRGGFVIRGIAPVKAADGKQLGSVEVLTSFAPVLAAVTQDANQGAALFMDAQFLKITTALQDPDKFPVVSEAFVLAVPSADGSVQKLVNVAFLSRSKEGLTMEIHGDQAIVGFPVRDYQGNAIGVIVHSSDVSQANAMISSVTGINGLILVLALGLAIILGIMMFVLKVQRPTNAIITKIKDIAEDRADLKAQLPVHSNDEIGELSMWFNRLTNKLDSIICGSEMYMNMVNAVPDPMFAVDNDMRIIVINDVVAKLFNKSREEIVGMQCRDLFQHEMCDGNDCPIKCAMAKGSRHESAIISMNIDGKIHHMRPFSDVVQDCEGNKIGYFEVLADVTDLIDNERTLNENMRRLENVGQEIQMAASSIADASQSVSVLVNQAQEGADQQSDRVGSTATAMEEMNATILEVARNAASAAEQGDQATIRARDGMGVVGDAVSAIGKVASLSEELKRDMGSLGERVDSIGKIMDVIQDIADQTNLLALNAAIEAARAGEAGRGFAVVADEVRKLAEKTMGATKEVGTAISAIQDGATKNIQGMEQAAHAVDEATGLASRSGDVLQEIVSLIEATVAQIQAIATAAEQQSATSEEINRSMEDINRISAETANGMANIAESLDNLESLSSRLKALSHEG